MNSGTIQRPGLPRIALAALAVAALAAGAGVGATPADDSNASAKPAEQPKAERAPNVTPAQAARRAGKKYGGKVLNVVLEHGPGGPYYQVKLLDGGSVRVVHIDARR